MRLGALKGRRQLLIWDYCSRVDGSCLLGSLRSLVKGILDCRSGHLGLKLIDKVNHSIIEPLRATLHHAEHFSFELAYQLLRPIYLRRWVLPHPFLIVNRVIIVLEDGFEIRDFIMDLVIKTFDASDHLMVIFFEGIRRWHVGGMLSFDCRIPESVHKVFIFAERCILVELRSGFCMDSVVNLSCIVVDHLHY